LAVNKNMGQMNSLLEKNLKFISAYNPELAEKILNHTALQANYEINEAQSGDKILFRNSIAVDDETDPVWSAVETFFTLVHKNKKSLTFLWGIGLGYNFREFAKRQTGSIILHETDIDLLRIAFELEDFSEELAKKNIIITNTDEDIHNAYNKLFFKGYNLNFAVSKYYEINGVSLLHKIKTEVHNLHTIYEQNYNNLWRKNIIWSSFLFNNISKIVKNQDLHVLKDKFKNKTAVIISAGPSLDKNIEDLKPYRDRLVIFCVAVAFKTAIKHGITPDFVMTIDNPIKVLDIPEIKDVNFVLSATSFPQLFKVKPKRFFNYYNKTIPVCKWLAAAIGINEINDYETAGTVSINCLYSAKLLGCDKIILIGQDLAYTDNKCYSDDSAYAYLKLNPQISEESQDMHAKLINKDLIKVRGINGSILLTRPDYYLFMLYFQKIAAEYASELKLINATEGGVYIEGYEHISLKQALEKYTGEKIDVESCINGCELSEKEISKRKQKVINELNFVLKNEKEVKNYINIGFKESFFSYFSPDFEEKQPASLRKKCLNLTHKSFEWGYLSDEENNTLQAFSKEMTVLKAATEAKLHELFANNPKKFGEILKKLKDTYLKMRKPLESNLFLKYYLFSQLLNIDNQIVDFENSDEDLINLALSLNSVFIMLSNHSLIYKEKINEIIAELKE